MSKLKMNNPLVTVNILSYNRKDELRYTLTKVFEQDYKNIEVIVVDNASSDGTQEMVKTEYPNVNLIELNENIGIAGWNKGFEVAKGEYVLVLDDDSYPGKNAINFVIPKFWNNNKIAICALKIINGSRARDETSDFKFPYIHFVGCGAIIRKKVFFEVGGFDPQLFIYAHESDFSIRVIDFGYTITFENTSIIYHRTNKYATHPINNSFYFFFSSRNNILLNFKYLPICWAISVTSKYIINRILVAAYFGYSRVLLRVLLESFTMILLKRIKRYKINKNTLILFNYRKMPIFDREYFGKLIDKDDSKFLFVNRYFKTLFYSKQKKKEFLF